jgi:deazaflavin-dependent oxidoreductase (nitroreductase family)
VSAVTDSETPGAGGKAEAENLFGDEHVKRYRETNGQVGHVWKNGSTVLILTTNGRKSGEPRSTPLIYGRSGDQYTVVASNGGSDEPPAWYRNMEEDPKAEIQVLGDRFEVRARDATPEEKPEMWKTMTEQWPDYDDYQRNTDREIPVVVLERRD